MYGANELFYNFCNVIVQSDKKILVDKHRTLEKHIEKLIQMKHYFTKSTQSILTLNTVLWERLLKLLCLLTYRCTSLTTNMWKKCLDFRTKFNSWKCGKGIFFEYIFRNAYYCIEKVFLNKKLLIYADESEKILLNI